MLRDDSQASITQRCMTACLSDWFKFMIRMLRHDSRGACHNERPLPKDAWRDRERQGCLREMYFTGGLHLHPEMLV
ncbi:hypothetical protein CEXT_251701 [Caerostris extrusa]|uniref:Uncharacterized protein n=1 Tax=Caerostris extrusa TaxID=172846 RepID=A0AAV4QWB1_CAEEX|nr:hypothetical protein CEXT_251701 [Caerostris extrusa]